MSGIMFFLSAHCMDRYKLHVVKPEYLQTFFRINAFNRGALNEQCTVAHTSSLSLNVSDGRCNFCCLQTTMGRQSPWRESFHIFYKQFGMTDIGKITSTLPPLQTGLRLNLIPYLKWNCVAAIVCKHFLNMTGSYSNTWGRLHPWQIKDYIQLLGACRVTIDFSAKTQLFSF